MDNQFFTWDDFVESFGREIRIAGDVYRKMVRSGLKENCLCPFDFTFQCDRKENLERLSDFIATHYPYTIKGIERADELWELNGVTNDIAVTEDNLLYWALDMARRGYELDAEFDAYGALFDPADQRFPDLNASTEKAWFERGLNQYNQGNLSGALMGWSHVIAINPRNANAFYSRAIVKNELYAWKAALRDYDAALEIAPRFFSALVNRGAVKDDNDDHRGAIADYDMVIDLASDTDDDKPSAYFNRGNAKLNLGDKKGACADWRKALELGAEYARERIAEHCSG